MSNLVGDDDDAFENGQNSDEEVLTGMDCAVTTRGANISSENINEKFSLCVYVTVFRGDLCQVFCMFVF